MERQVLTTCVFSTWLRMDGPIGGAIHLHLVGGWCLSDLAGPYYVRSNVKELLTHYTRLKYRDSQSILCVRCNRRLRNVLRCV